MPAFVQVVGFDTNPSPGVANADVYLDFTFQNIGDEVTQDDHPVDVSVTDPNGAAQYLGQLNVTLDANGTTQTGLPFTPTVQGDWTVDATPAEGGPFQGTFTVV